MHTPANTSSETMIETSTQVSLEAHAEPPHGIVITENEWKNKRKTELFGLAKEPHRGKKKIPGYAPILLREDAFAMVKQMALQTGTKIVGAKEILTAIVLVSLDNEALQQAVMPRAKSIVREDVAKELERAEAEGL